MARHDWRCAVCDKYYPDIIISGSKIKNSVAIFEKPCSCGCFRFRITWESGEAPKGYVHQETIGDLWKKKGMDPMSEKSRKATNEAIIREQSNRKDKNA